MDGKRGQLARMGDVWYQIMDKRYNINELNGMECYEYLLYTRKDWVPEAWITDVKDKSEFHNSSN